MQKMESMQKQQDHIPFSPQNTALVEAYNRALDALGKQMDEVDGKIWELQQQLKQKPE